MTVTSFTPLLGLALPTTGDLSGTWGTTVNTAITDLLDDAVAGTVTLTTDTNVTLTTTNGADNQARNAVILCTGARTALRTITAPAQSKLYVIINATTGGFGVKIVGAGPTTGITVLAGTQVMVAWNGSDFVVSSGDLVGPTSSTDNAITRFDSTTGKLVQNSVVTVADDGAIVAPQAGSTIPFYFANQTVFPSAATYHGALAHSHSDGAMYFAHSSAWVRLLDADTDVTVAQGGTGIGTTTAYSVVFSGTTATGSFQAAAGPGTATYVLTSNGAGALPTFQAPTSSGTVTSASVVSANGFAGTVATATTTPAITLTTSISGVLKGNATAISAAVAGTDYVTPTGSETLTNKTLTNPTVTNYVETAYTANSSTAITLSLTNGTVQIITLTGNATITMPAVGAGKSFTILLKQDATGSRTVTWTTVSWPSATAPTITSTASKMDKYVFISDGTYWYGSNAGQNYT